MFPIVQMHSIVKVYPYTLLKANDHVDLTLNEREILSLAGENGAGKTTLMKILYGMEEFDEGMIEVDGKKVNISSPLDAARLGIGMVQQHVTLVDEFTVAQNVVLGKENTVHHLLYDERKNSSKVATLIEENHFSVEPDALVGSLSVGEKQQVEILKMLYRDVRVLILDEPTAVLTSQEIDALFSTLRSLQSKGVSIILITHKLHEILEISDRVAIMRQGAMIGTYETSLVDEQSIGRMMMGETAAVPAKILTSIDSDRIVLSVDHVSIERHNQKQPLLDDIHFDLFRGEILGCTGISGNGLGQLESVLLGELPISKGKIFYHDTILSSEHKRARTREIGLPFVPSDRLYTGSSLTAPVSENMIATSREKFFPPFGIRKRKIQAYTRQLISRYKIKSEPYQAIGTLSGGNIQKVILAREIEKVKDVIICCEPTWGLDASSASFIHEQIIKLRNSGIGVLLLSSNLDEIISLSDRLLIFSRGAVVARFGVGEVSTMTKESLGPFLLGKAVRVKRGKM
ncbi:MAG: ABC transporter ATP-binding protein [Sphaerochaetaceae bacterium]|nr:ABC transporter ATP-binding protein [Sphaerochaetaceae bacterium]